MTHNSSIGRRTARGLGLAGSAAALAPRRLRAQPKEVKIAMVVPLSGPWARQGILEQMGARMAVDDINNAGGIKSMGGAKIHLLEYDTGDSAEKAKDAAQRMLAQAPDVVGGFGCWLSTFTLAVTEVTERAKMPWLTLSYSDLIATRQSVAASVTRPDNLHAACVSRATRAMSSAQGCMGPAAMSGFAPWSMTIRKAGWRRANSSTTGRCGGRTNASNTKPRAAISPSAGCSSGRRIHALSGMSCSIGRKPFSRVSPASAAIRAGESVAPRSTQPTTPRTRPPESRAVRSRNCVSASVGAACTSTVALISPSRGCRSCKP